MTILERDTVERFILAKCPCCGQKIMIPKDRTECYCTFCGKSFLSEAAVVYATATALSDYRPKVSVESGIDEAVHPLPHMLTIKEVANKGILTETALRRLIKQERIPVVYVGKKALINYDKLVEFLSLMSRDPEQ